jgi:hypothetical protein
VTPVNDQQAAVRLLIAREPSEVGDRPDLSGWLQRLCRVAARTLPATGVGISLMSEDGNQIRVAASDAISDVIEEFEFTFGEGPCTDSFEQRRAVLTPDLWAATGTKWLGYGPAAHHQGVRAVFAFPLQMRDARLGVMDVYGDHVGAMSEQALSQAQSFADVAFETLIEAKRLTGENETVLGLDDGWDTRLGVFQAQGMIMIQLGVNPDEAMVRLRAHAFRHNRRLADVATDVLQRRVLLERDTE